MQPTSELITVERDCEAILIPSGDPIKLIKGTHVRITQALGGDYTLFVNGNLVKISGDDADAIGKTREEETSDVQKKNDEPVQEEQVWEQLRTVYDPEIPVNIVELGLIYDLQMKYNLYLPDNIHLTNQDYELIHSYYNMIQHNFLFLY